jgi:hypothetical protein
MGLLALGVHWPGVKIGALALLLPSAEPVGFMSVHCGPVASIEMIGPTSGAPHAPSEKSPTDPVQVLPVGALHAHASQERPSVKES